MKYNIEKAKSVWQEIGIDYAIIDFTCGGDQMGDMSISYYGKNKKTNKTPKPLNISNEELDDFFLEDDVFKHVEFYVNSDGYYQGEQGTIDIRFEEGEFSYCKNAEAEFSETQTTIFKYKLTDDQVSFFKSYVKNINGSDNDYAINYKTDFVLDNKTEEMLEDICQVILEHAENVEFDADGDPEEGYTWTSLEDAGQIKINKDELLIQVDRRFTIFKPSEN